MANIKIIQALQLIAQAAKDYTDDVAATKVNLVTGKGLSTNDLTTALMNNYNAAYTHSQAAHAPSNAQKNSDITKSEIEAKLTGEITTHSHSYAGSSSAGGAATSANKVNSSLIVKINSGTTEGTDMYTFNGSAAKTINITPAAIGASVTSHTHDDKYYTESEMDTKLAAKADSEHGTHVTYGTTATSLTSGGTGAVGTSSSVARADHTHTLPAYPTSLKSPNSIVVKLNGGTTEGTNLFTYDGSAAKTINITPAAIGAAGSSHGTHLTLGTGSGNAYRGDYGDAAYQHSLAAHAPSTAQKNSDITKAEIEAKLTGSISSHTHSYLPLSGGTLTGALTVAGKIADSRITTGNQQVLNASTGIVYVGNPGTALHIESSSNPSVTVGSNTYTMYHTGNKPTYSDVGAAQANHGTHVSYGGNGSASTVSRSDHTHNYAGSSSAGGAATSANKVNTNLVVKLNGGTTEGTDYFTFNGSAAKTIDVTPAAIGASASGHNHDDKYYTESEMNTKINTINTAISNAQSAAQSYADTKIAALVNSAPEAMNTLKELADAIDAHQDVYDAYVADMSAALAEKAPVSHGNHVPKTETADNARFLRNDNTWATITPANIGAAGASHGTHVTWATNVPAANGTASVGSVARVAREDHVHPLQTTVSGNAGSANKVNNSMVVKLNGGTTEGTNMFTFNGSAAKTINITPSSIGAAASEHGTHLTLGTGSGNAFRGDYGNTAYNHSQAAHAPSDAQPNQNAFSNFTVGTTTIAADSATDTLTFVAGDNITLTPDATNDKITIVAKDTVYTHPSHTAYSSGLYKVTVNNLGHVTAATAVTSADIANLGVQITDNDYRVKTTAAATTKLYLTGCTGATTGELKYDGAVYLDTTAGHLTATQFNGALNGNAATATSATTATTCTGNAGSATKLANARNITIGAQTKSFDGTGAISFDLATIGIEQITDTEINAMITEIFG